MRAKEGIRSFGEGVSLEDSRKWVVVILRKIEDVLKREVDELEQVW
jgi:hypothetical protein